MPIVDRLSLTMSQSGSAGQGGPRGTWPTSATPCAPRSKSPDAIRPPTTSTSAPGDRRSREAEGRESRRVRRAPTARVVQWIWPSPWSQVQSSRQALSPLEDVPVSFDSSPIVTSIAAPARKPVITAFERNRAIQPSRNSASSRKRTPVTMVIAATSWAASCASEPGCEDGAARHRGERGARPGRDLTRGAEERVDDRAGRRRVQAVLQGHARDAGVAEVLRHDQSGDGNAGHQVAPQPAAVVPGEPLRDRQHPAEPLGRPVARVPELTSRRGRGRLCAECGDGGVDRREEVGRVDGAGELVALDLLSDRVLHLGEHERDAVGVELMRRAPRACRRPSCRRR